MRGDFFLPGLLSVTLAAMAVYAATGDGNTEATLRPIPATCENSALISTLNDIPEASGVATSLSNQGVFWIHNDSAEPYVFAVDKEGKRIGRVRLAGGSVKDWEAVTTAPCGSESCLYVGDIGDNDRNRPSITIYRTVEPSPSARASADAVAIEASYPEGPQDAEAMFVLDGSLFIVTKGEGAPVRVYRLPSLEGGAKQALQLVASLTDTAAEKSSRVTDAAVSPDGRRIAMRSNDVVYFYDAAALRSGNPGTPRAVDVRHLKEPQGEGLAWADAQSLVLAGESGGAGGGTFASLTCGNQSLGN